MSRKGNPLGLIKGVRKNPYLSPSAKAKAIRTLKAQARKMGQLPKVRQRTPNPNYLEQIQRTTVSTVSWYIALSAIGFAVSFISPLASGLFTISQLLMLVKDIGDADDKHRLLQNFVAGFLNGLVGWVLIDGLVWMGGVLVCVVVIAVALDEFG